MSIHSRPVAKGVLACADPAAAAIPLTAVTTPLYFVTLYVPADSADCSLTTVGGDAPTGDTAVNGSTFVSPSRQTAEGNAWLYGYASEATNAYYTVHEVTGMSL